MLTPRRRPFSSPPTSPGRTASRLTGALAVGAALTLAALGAQGESVIGGLPHIDRGYQGLEKALAALGGHIRRVTGPA